MRYAPLGIFLLGGCALAPAVSPRSAPPLTGDGSLYLRLESPEPGQDLAVTVANAQGRTVASETAPSGAMRFRLAPGDYALSFALARGVPLPGCDVRVSIASQHQTMLGTIASPPACRPPLWGPDPDLRAGGLPWYRGTRADIKTAPGDYDGYSISACDSNSASDIFYVTGHGTTRAPDNTDRTHDAEFNQFYNRIEKRVESAMKPMASGAGMGISCRRADQPAGVTVYVSDWRQTDEILRRLGTVIREENLGLGFTVKLMGIAIPL